MRRTAKTWNGDDAVVARNRAATFHYTIRESFEAGVVLKGSEVKSIREGRVDITEAYASVERGEVFLRQMYVASFLAARAFPHVERGVRKLLLHAREIRYLERTVGREGFTLVPLDLHFRGGRVKVTLGLARGKKVHDKRAALAEKTAEAEMLQTIREHRDRQRR